MKNEIEQCITALFTSLSAESEKEMTIMFNDAISTVKNSANQIDKPEDFDLFINYKLKKGIMLLANTLHEPSVCKNKEKPNFIYCNYSFLNNHVRNLCVLREGTTCCADKTRYILKMYLKYTLTGEIPIFNPNIEKYYIPNFGDNQMWINYCDSLYELYYGNPINYLKTYSKLIQSEIRKFKHILHKWYIEFNDGEIIEFDQSWDDRSENPLDYFDKGEFYTMHKAKIQNKHFDIYNPISEEEKMLCKHNYLKIPKSVIKRIFKNSEEKMI